MIRLTRRRAVIASASVLLVVWACTSGQPLQIFGPSVSGNIAPTLEFTAPGASFSISQGERFDIQWVDSDTDDNAEIAFFLVATEPDEETGQATEVLLVSGIQENDSVAADEFSVSTTLVPFGTYYLRALIDDGNNVPVPVFALIGGSATSRVEIKIDEPGTNPLAIPPRVAVVAPFVNQGVAQEDTLVILVSPTDAAPNVLLPYDADSDAELFILLDLDDDPENDFPALPDSEGFIMLRENVEIPQGEFGFQAFNIPIDLNDIPARENGEPYYVRATIIDEGNLPVHAYAKGTINIVKLAVNPVDLSEIGKTLSGVRFLGFNPGSLLGTRTISAGDFDGDGVDDLLMVAQFGNPRNFGNIGEAYLVYGMNNVRFGGEINVNEVSRSVEGVIFEAPPNRLTNLHTDPADDPRGITGAAVIRDLSGDGRPEILFGLPLVDGMYQGRDDDPGDDPDTQAVSIFLTEELVRRDLNDIQDETLDDDYRGSADTYIDRLRPTTSFGSASTLVIGASLPPDDDNPPDQFIIVGFPGLLNLFTTTDTDDINDLEVWLELTLVAGQQLPFPDSITAHALLGGFSENVEYSDFGADGEPGPTEDNEYDTDDLDVEVNFIEQSFRVDVTATIEAFLDGELANEPSWILIPAGALSFSAEFYSSESTFDALRPNLSITYSETLTDDNATGNLNCYPDPYVNNLANEPDDDSDGNTVDHTGESCGAVMLLNSENRDSDPSIGGATRLGSTVVTLELVGQENVMPAIFATSLDFASSAYLGFVDPPASQIGPTIHQLATDDDGITRGVRITAGYWEYINNGSIGMAAPRRDFFGEHVASLPDVNNDGDHEIMISAPRNELYFSELQPDFLGGPDWTIWASTAYTGSILVIAGEDFSVNELQQDSEGNTTIPAHGGTDFGSCSGDREARWGPGIPTQYFEIFAEDVTDYLGGAEYAGDVNLDGVPDIVCGAPQNDHPNGMVDSGAVYIIYVRTPVGNVSLVNLDTPGLRPPTLRIRGEKAGDRLGTVQNHGMDVNGDRIADVFIGSPTVDHVVPGVVINECSPVVDVELFNDCRSAFGDEVFLDDGLGGDSCKQFDYDNDRMIDGDDREVFDCIVAGFSNCCPVDNGFVGVVFGDVSLDGDRDYTQIGTSDLPGVRFYGASAGDRAGTDVVSAGDFNRDGFGDLLIAAPGVLFTDSAGNQRMGVAYLIFGGTHLVGQAEFSLAEVGTSRLPGVILWTPFVAQRPNEAPIERVGQIGDINNDGFDDIAIGIPRADFVDQSLPQDPNDPGTSPNVGRRPDDGSVYIIYGNNTGSNE